MRFGKAAAMAGAAASSLAMGLGGLLPVRELDPGRSGGFSGRYPKGYNSHNSGSIAADPHKHERVIARHARAQERITRNRAARAFRAIGVDMLPEGSAPTRAISYGLTRTGRRVAL